jgi:hypothetical protein
MEGGGSGAITGPDTPTDWTATDVVTIELEEAVTVEFASPVGCCNCWSASTCGMRFHVGLLGRRSWSSSSGIRWGQVVVAEHSALPVRTAPKGLPPGHTVAGPLREAIERAWTAWAQKRWQNE